MRPTKLAALVTKPGLARETRLKHKATSVSHEVTRCLADNTDCAAAKANYAKSRRTIHPELMSPAEYDRNLTKGFYSSFPQCQGK